MGSHFGALRSSQPTDCWVAFFWAPTIFEGIQTLCLNAGTDLKGEPPPKKGQLPRVDASACASVGAARGVSTTGWFACSTPSARRRSDACASIRRLEGGGGGGGGVGGLSLKGEAAT